MKPDYKLVAKAKYIHMTADLASEIWHEVYKRYFSAKQLDALVESFQSADAIEEDIDNDVNYFLVFLGSQLIGYFAWKMENTSLHLLHLYLKPAYRGKAIGRDIVASCERLARGEGRGRVWCGVNAKALPVQQFFKARGYRSLGPAESEGGIELSAMEQRYNIAEKLMRKQSYTSIMGNIGASSAIISRVSRVLSRDDSVLRRILEKNGVSTDAEE